MIFAEKSLRTIDCSDLQSKFNQRLWNFNHFQDFTCQILEKSSEILEKCLFFLFLEHFPITHFCQTRLGSRLRNCPNYRPQLTPPTDFGTEKARLFSTCISKFRVTSFCHPDEETCDSGKILDKGQTSILANANEAKMRAEVAERSAERQLGGEIRRQNLSIFAENMV